MRSQREIFRSVDSKSESNKICIILISFFVFSSTWILVTDNFFFIFIFFVVNYNEFKLKASAQHTL